MRGWCWDRVLIAGLASIVFVGCATLPKITEKPVSVALAVPPSGPLAETSGQLAWGRARTHSSVLLLEGNREALQWRLALLDSARSSIDIQLYLWHEGASSSLLFDRLLKAADRGVRVRLLVDDFLLRSSEGAVAALSRNHPHFEIRVFNPNMWRINTLHKALEFVARFDRLNRRMHNKTWTVDRCMSIVGGRNVSDSYFGLAPHYNFVDLDVLAAGPVVADISDGFDEYWNSSGAYPGAMLSERGTPDDVAELRAGLANRLEESGGLLQSYARDVRDWSGELAALRRTMAHGPVRFVQDRAEAEEDDRQVVSSLRMVAGNQEKDVILITPYLIPSRQGLAGLSELVGRGVRVRILAPSLGANNQALVHGHYRKFRKPIFDAGAELYEMRPDLSPEALKHVDVPPGQAERACLHAKAVVGDRQRCFIGSLNLDPRAVDINSECGLLIDSEELTRELLAYVKTLIRPENSWAVSRDARGRLLWSSDQGVQTKEPPAGFAAKLLSGISGVLPIQGQL